MTAVENATLTVQQVIDRLAAIEDKTLPVWADGCDCTNPVTDVTVGDVYVQIAVRL
jgi:hypothetical protein